MPGGRSLPVPWSSLQRWAAVPADLASRQPLCLRAQMGMQGWQGRRGCKPAGGPGRKPWLAKERRLRSTFLFWQSASGDGAGRPGGGDRGKEVDGGVGAFPSSRPPSRANRSRCARCTAACCTTTSRSISPATAAHRRCRQVSERPGASLHAERMQAPHGHCPLSPVQHACAAADKITWCLMRREHCRADMTCRVLS